MAKLNGAGLYIGRDWVKRNKAKEIILAGNALTKDIVDVFWRHRFAPEIFSRMKEIAAEFEKALPPIAQQTVGRSIRFSEREENYIWLAVERVTKIHEKETGKRNVSAALASIYPLRPKKSEKYIAGGPLHAVGCSATARRVHSKVARRLRSNERSLKLWTSFIDHRGTL